MNILFLTHRLPYAPNRGDRIRAYYMLREMSRFADVSLFSLVHDEEEEARAADVPFTDTVVTLRTARTRNFLRGTGQLATERPLTHALLDAPGILPALTRIVSIGRPDVVVAYCSGMARFAMESPLADVPFVLDMVDVDSEKWRELAVRTRGPRQWVYAREARTLATFEAAASRQARSVLVVSDREREALRVISPTADVHVIANGVDADAFAPPGAPSANNAVVFCGVMNYEPNVDGVLWFARHVWPRVRAAKPDARFLVVGANPVRAVRDLAEADSSIAVTGSVEAVQPYLWQSAVAVAPLRTARGLQNKVLEALAAGLPVVVTSSVQAGLPSRVTPGCVRADEPHAFATEVLQLLNHAPDSRRALASAASLDRLTWQSELSAVQDILRNAAKNVPNVQPHPQRTVAGTPRWAGHPR